MWRGPLLSPWCLFRKRGGNADSGGVEGGFQSVVGVGFVKHAGGVAGGCTI